MEKYPWLYMDEMDESARWHRTAEPVRDAEGFPQRGWHDVSGLAPGGFNKLLVKLARERGEFIPSTIKLVGSYEMGSHPQAPSLRLEADMTLSECDGWTFQPMAPSPLSAEEGWLQIERYVGDVRYFAILAPEDYEVIS